MAKKIDLYETFQMDGPIKRILLVLYKAMAIPSVIVAILIFLDLILPPGSMDKGIVMSKKKQIGYIEIQSEKFH